MHYTLHITNQCNMSCKYCYVDNKTITLMSIDTAKKVIDLAAKTSNSSTGIIFFGGEPLLHKDIIYETVEYGKWKSKVDNKLFHYKVTTNGTLLNKEFVDFSLKENIFIALSHDGIKKAHDSNRIFSTGKGTFNYLEEKIDLLLKARPYSPVLMVVNPNTVKYYFDSIEYLYNKGFSYLIPSLNYAGKWDDYSLQILFKEYKKLAKWYKEKTLNEEKFYLAPFEVKMSSHINVSTYCKEICELGLKQISVSPDGLLYPCVQFVGEKEYNIGTIEHGIDENNRQRLFYQNKKEKSSCENCAIKNRCNNHCGCMNKQSTGSIEKVSPVLCENERMLIPIVDNLASYLYKKKNGLFIQKQYNDVYPLLSMIEDKT